MKFTCEQKELAQAIAQVHRAVPARPTNPILANILLIAKEETLVLRAYDLAIGIEAGIPADISESGAIAVPAKLFADIVSRLPNEPIEVAVESGAVHLCSSGKYEIRGLDADSFPDLPTFSKSNAIQLNTSVLSSMSSVVPFVSGDDTKAILQGVYWSFTKDSLELAATDGHRLSVVSTEVQSSSESSFVVPGKAMGHIQKLGGEGVEIFFDGVHLVATGKACTIYSRLLDGQYPNYRQLIPGGFSSIMTANRLDLLAVLERVAIVAGQSRNVVNLSLDSGSMNVSSTVETSQAEELVSVSFSGEPVTIAFNVSYLIEALKVMTVTEISLEMNTPTSPAVLRPLGGMKLTHLLMPVQVRND